jgi:integrase
MPANRIAAKRPYGSGCLFVSRGAGGTETWFGKWRVDGRQVKRRIGPKRAPGSQDGLTKAQAGRHLTEMIAELKTPPVVERVTVGDAGRQLIRHREWLGRKRSTLQGYDSFLRIHLVPYFGERSLERIGPRDIEAFMCECRDRGQSVKTTLNYVGLLHGIFDYALRRGWVASNPCKLVDKPRSEEVDPDIHFLDQAELDALLAAVPDDYLGLVERTMYRAAAMTGMRQGELLALRWLDVDWPARRIRIRRNFVRGEFGTPKSKRSSRSVPLADVLGGDLDRLYQTSAYQADEDLVFAHPHTGRPMDRSKLLKRFKAALRAAGVREIRFHDLRHTFGTRMAAAGVPMRTLQEWMGHRDFKTTLIYADYMPGEREADLVNAAFRSSTSLGRSPAEAHGRIDTDDDPSGNGCAERRVLPEPLLDQR